MQCWYFILYFCSISRPPAPRSGARALTSRSPYATAVATSSHGYLRPICARISSKTRAIASVSDIGISGCSVSPCPMASCTAVASYTKPCEPT
eukprot:scaffold59762_cov51-Phaeocystis_antarctica.AAC.1